MNRKNKEKEIKAFFVIHNLKNHENVEFIIEAFLDLHEKEIFYNPFKGKIWITNKYIDILKEALDYVDKTWDMFSLELAIEISLLKIFESLSDKKKKFYGILIKDLIKPDITQKWINSKKINKEKIIRDLDRYR